MRLALAGGDFTFRWPLVPSRARSLPSGELSILVVPRNDGAIAMDVAYVRAGRRPRGVDRRMFDDGLVVIDWRYDGSVAGVEFLAKADWAEVPEFAAEVARDARHGHLLAAACDTTTHAWSLLRFWFHVAGSTRTRRASAEVKRELARLQRQILAARPDLRRWKTPAPAGSVAVGV